MDIRETINKNDTFLPLLQQLFNTKNRVNLLVDNNGITHTEGLITSINTSAAQPFIEMDNGMKITLASIVAVNGTFHPDYSEC